MGIQHEFICPHCAAILQKSQECLRLADMRNGVLVAERRYDPCPRCGQDIDRAAIINGQYDIRRSSRTANTALWTLVLVPIVLVLAVVALVFLA
jgi:predicted RNA-binding Zn-ribbon protein involved in translation (DUF1610 family)